MCIGCWHEAGSPRLDGPEIRRVAELAKQIYEYASAGSNCHVVLDDFNIEDSSVRFCLDAAKADPTYNEVTPEQRSIEVECMTLMLAMTEDERASALARWEGWVQ